MKKIQKALALFATLGLASLAGAQEATDGFVVPLDQDFSKAVTAAPANQGGGSDSPVQIKQGLWIEVTSSNKALIRDIATGEKKGYEFDNAHFLSEANWWFWGDIGTHFHLDAEIAAWNFDKTLFQANSYADNDPKMSWKDGFQQLAAMPFSWFYNANDNGIGAFNKMGFTITTPWVEAKLGYGKLKANGMLDFSGIYHVIDRWDSVEKGFTELSLGKDFQKIGDVTINATAAFSMMRSAYGMYDLLDVTYGEDAANPLVHAALTFGSLSTETALFDYADSNTNALSAYLAAAPIDPLTLEFHTIMTFGSDVDLDGDALAFAGRVGWKAEKWSARVMESYAAKNVTSVWGSDGQDYDNIRAGTIFTQIDADVSPLDWLTIGVDEGLSLPTDDDADGAPGLTLSYADYTTADFSLRNQPYVDVALGDFVGTDVTLGAYGIIYVDKAVSGKKDNTIVTFQGAGLEATWAPGFSLLQKLKFDYALDGSYNKWTSSAGSSYKKNVTYHNIILHADLTENFSAFGGMIYRSYETSSDANQPLGFALGCAFNRTVLPGHPKLWMHFAYGMDPFEDNNYSLYRKDDPMNKPLHRTYLLNTLDENMAASFIRVGLIWDL